MENSLASNGSCRATSGDYFFYHKHSQCFFLFVAR